MSTASASVVIHGHFYQPPREDPWLELVPREPSAAPFHDWNRRIEHECYRAVVAARLLDDRGRIRRVVNALALMSFDVGPTLLSWLEREAPETYAAIQDADRASCRRLDGHGNAMAMPYHHVILPLSTPRDRLTEVRWGVADFRRRFGREPEGMWLPETAVDDATLDALAREGIAFTVLAPHQVKAVPARGLPGLYRTREGREIAVFVYDGEVSHDVAFGSLLSNGVRWAEKMATRNRGRLLTSVATDGETYGHHHRFGEMALVTALETLEAARDVRVESYASFLARNPPEEEVALVEPSSWSCVHGVERWRSACGCALAPQASTHQEWRAPLREAITWLAERLRGIYEAEGARYFADPWEARDAYGAVTAAPDADAEAFVRGRALRPLAPEEAVRARELLEMARDALRTFTSCAWFFDDLARIEAIQVLRYAARAIELAGDAGAGLEEELRVRLARAESNDPAVGDGRNLYDMKVRPPAPAPYRVAAGCALLTAAGEPCEGQVRDVGAYRAELRSQGEVGILRRSTGRRSVFRVHVEGEGAHVRAARVAPVDGGDERLLTPADLPEPLKEHLEAAFRRAIVRTHLDAEERRALANGDQELGQVASTALVRWIRTLDEKSDEPAGPALDILRLLEILNRPIPWEARSAFARVMDGSAQVSPGLRSLAAALGFAVEERGGETRAGFQRRPAAGRVSLFVTCLADHFFAEAAADAVRLLRSLGVDVLFPEDQSCCGQPAFNAGHLREARGMARRTLKVLGEADYVVIPSGSCAAMIRNHYVDVLSWAAGDGASPEGAAVPDDAEQLAARTFELAEFLVKVLNVTNLGRGLEGTRVAYHHGCHALRSLGLRDEPVRLLEGAGAQVVAWEADEECCGFGGLFSVKMPEVSAAMADRKLDTLPEADVLTSADGGCLLQLRGRAARRGSGTPPVRHLASLLWRATGEAR